MEQQAGLDREFFLSRQRDVELSFRVLPYPSPDRPQQEIEIALNGRALERVGLSSGWGEYRVRVPASATVSGHNRLDFRYAWTVVPAAQGGSKDRRGLGVAWDSLTFGDIDPIAATADPERELVILPAGTRADFYLEATPGSRLIVPAMDVRGSAILLITVATDSTGEGPGVTLAELSDAVRDLEFALPDVSGPIRLRLEVPRGTNLSNTGFAAISGAAVVAPRPEASNRPKVRAASTPSNRRPNIILYVIDTLRADHLGTYGYERPISPRIDSLANEGVLFEDTQAQASWTKPSAASILTGLLPWRHGAVGERDRLSAEAPSLARILQDNGYRTGAVSANGYVSKAFGFDQGFGQFIQAPSSANRSGAVHTSALAWLDSLHGDEPFFLYVHTIDPHNPYAPPEDLRLRFAARVKDPDMGSIQRMKARLKGAEAATPAVIADLLALYDAEIADNDRELGRFLDSLKQRGWYEDTLLIVSSDHGEEFYEHGAWTHRLSLYSEVLEVPLIIRFPGGWKAGTRVVATAQHVDFMPTILDYLDLPAPNELDGQSLLRFIDHGPGATVRRAVFSHLSIAHGSVFSAVFEDRKLITAQLAGRSRPPELYRRRSDPREQEDLASKYPVTAGYLTSLIRAELAKGGPAPAAEPAQLDEETRRNLEALGYIN